MVTWSIYLNRWAMLTDGTPGDVSVKRHGPGDFVQEFKPRWYSLERPWEGNQRRISCIPSGNYRMFLRPSRLMTRLTKGALTHAYEVRDVPDRSQILFGHPGNTISDSLGCILLVSSLTGHWGHREILAGPHSIRACLSLYDFLGGVYERPDSLDVANLPPEVDLVIKERDLSRVLRCLDPGE